MFWLFLDAVLSCEWSTIQRAGSAYYCWRTRNPIVWHAHAKICRAVTPSLLDGRRDPVGEQACVRLAMQLYPGHTIEAPDMIMRNAYPNITHHRQPKAARESALNTVFASKIPNTVDSIFTVGVIDRDTLRKIREGHPV
jgi:hypothetical protein